MYTSHKHKTVIFLEDCFCFCSIKKEERHKLSTHTNKENKTTWMD
jgi:hypothetical protein